jgi:aryl-alcohol dehydrogenase-like predicted oxidoreductase
METRQLGGVDMRVGVLGFGGAENGFERAEPAAAAQLLGEALDAGLNMIDTAKCYLDFEAIRACWCAVADAGWVGQV